MPYYLLQGNYTSEAWTRLVANPQDRTEAIRPVVEGLGGSVVGSWVAFGEYDIVAIYHLPDHVTAAAFAMAVAAGGAVRNLKTTLLMTGQEAVQALQKAARTGYRPPG